MDTDFTFVTHLYQVVKPHKKMSDLINTLQKAERIKAKDELWHKVIF